MVAGYGNIMNRVMEGLKSPVPEVGMPCTVLMYSDRYAAEVIEVSKSKRRVVVRYMHAKEKHQGMTENQDWELTSVPNGKTDEFSLRKSGRWVQKGAKGNGTGLGLGYHDHYYDYGF